MTKYQEYFDAKFAELKKNMATKDCIQNLYDTIFKQNDEEISILQSKVEVMEKYVCQLEKKQMIKNSITGGCVYILMA